MHTHSQSIVPEARRNFLQGSAIGNFILEDKPGALFQIPGGFVVMREPL
jgi:hypothetical protein